MQRNGRVIEEQKNYYMIDTEQGVIRAVFKGAIKKKCPRLFVGDLVAVEQYNLDIPEGIIRSVHPRKNSLAKPPVANLDQIILINTMKEPALDLEFIDRFLFAAEVLEHKIIIAFNKIDLLNPQEMNSLDSLLEYYEKIGYTAIKTSALMEETVRALCEKCSGALSIFAGQSGTGKSTLLSKIFPEREFRIGELSKNIHRGIHTTTSTVLLKLAGRGFIADSPGFSYIDLPELPFDYVVSYFRELEPLVGKCRFNNCMHENEPGCIIRDMVEKGNILESRYRNYLKIYNIMRGKNRDYTRKRI